jgi:hypothetical protein
MGAYGIKVKSLAALQDTLMRGDLKTRRSAEKILASFPEELGPGAWSFGE